MLYRTLPNPECRTSAGHHALTIAVSICIWGLPVLAWHVVAVWLA